MALPVQLSEKDATIIATIIQRCLEEADVSHHLTTNKASPHEVFVSMLLDKLDKIGVPGAMRIALSMTTYLGVKY